MEGENPVRKPSMICENRCCGRG